MFVEIVALIVGLGVLVWSADRFIEGSAILATHYGVSPLTVGVVFVGFGTSAPEIVVSLMAALEGNPGLALGNAFGSNIINIGLVIGVTALISPLVIHSRVIRQEMPLLLAVTLIASLILLEGSLRRWEGSLLLSGFFLVVGWMLFAAGSGRSDALGLEVEEELKGRPKMSSSKALMMALVGLVVLILSSRLLVWASVELAQALGVSDLVIGLTLVALGTSMPELAASITAALKREDDIAVGNIIGSNVFNLLAVIGIAGVVAPIEQLDREILSRDLPAVVLFTLAMFAFGFGFRGQGQISRTKGGVLLAGFAAYLWLLFSSL